MLPWALPTGNSTHGDGATLHDYMVWPSSHWVACSLHLSPLLPTPALFHPVCPSCRAKPFLIASSCILAQNNEAPSGIGLTHTKPSCWVISDDLQCQHDLPVVSGPCCPRANIFHDGLTSQRVGFSEETDRSQGPRAGSPGHGLSQACPGHRGFHVWCGAARDLWGFRV